MLLPEQNRSGFPYLISVGVQCSVVLLLAIPWTVQQLKNTGPLQMPTILAFQNLKPMDPIKTSHTQATTPSSLPALPRQYRIFVASSSGSSASASARIDAPEIEIGPGGTSLIGLAVPTFPNVAVNPILSPIPPAPTVLGPAKPTIVGGNVQAAKLIHRVQPTYPAIARQARIQGVVTLEAIISADGAIQQLHVLSGHPMLIRSAVEAVEQWMYTPTSLNGKAVEVKTTIDVRFTLSDR